MTIDLCRHALERTGDRDERTPPLQEAYVYGPMGPEGMTPHRLRALILHRRKVGGSPWAGSAGSPAPRRTGSFVPFVTMHSPSPEMTAYFQSRGMPPPAHTAPQPLTHGDPRPKATPEPHSQDDAARPPRAPSARSRSRTLTACGGDGKADRMNVLLITLDTTRPDRMSCYGGQPGLTPTIDAFAAEGVRFERAISTAGITPMSHSSILTGLNNYAHGMRVFYSPDVSHRLKEVVDTLPEVLQPLGYRTAARVSSYPVSEAYGLDQGFEDFESGVNLDELDLERQQRHSTSWDAGGRTKTQRRGDFTTTSALQWLDANGKDGPWCMWVHMFDVHDYSLVPPAEFMERFGLPEYPPAGARLGVEARLDWRERIYDPELAFMDAQIARIRAWLDENGQLDNTVVVITADHGQDSGTATTATAG